MDPILMFFVGILVACAAAYVTLSLVTDTWKPQDWLDDNCPKATETASPTAVPAAAIPSSATTVVRLKRNCGTNSYGALYAVYKTDKLQGERSDVFAVSDDFSTDPADYDDADQEYEITDTECNLYGKSLVLSPKDGDALASMGPYKHSATGIPAYVPNGDRLAFVPLAHARGMVDMNCANATSKYAVYKTNAAVPTGAPAATSMPRVLAEYTATDAPAQTLEACEAYTSYVLNATGFAAYDAPATGAAPIPPYVADGTNLAFVPM
jgi:hypothetical protein